MDRIEMTYKAIDQMIDAHGKPRTFIYGGGVWDAEEEFKLYKEQVGDRYTPLQWTIIETYFKTKFKEVKNGRK